MAAVGDLQDVNGRMQSWRGWLLVLFGCLGQVASMWNSHRASH